MNMTHDSLKEASSSANLEKPASLGEILRSKRFERDLSISDVSKQLHLSSSIISALEDEEYSKLPGKTFVKGYLRAYARLLKLPEKIIDEYIPSEVSESGTTSLPVSMFKKQASVNDPGIRWLTYLILFGLAVLVIMWWNNHQTSVVAPDELGNAIDVTSSQMAMSNTSSAQVNASNPHPVAPVLDIQPLQGFDTTPSLVVSESDKQLNADLLNDGQSSSLTSDSKTYTKKKSLPAAPPVPKGGLVTTRNLSLLENDADDLRMEELLVDNMNDTE